MVHPYHKYVFDEEARRFVGDFEEMYEAEQAESFDSWFQGSMATLQRQISLAILSHYNFSSILDLGCGKGHFSYLLKKENNRVIGIDSSPTAIRRAKAHYPDIDFLVLDVMELDTLGDKCDLIIASEVLFYCAQWKQLLVTISERGERLFISLFLPDRPIGFIKSFDELREELTRSFEIETEMIQDGQQAYVLARANR